MKLQNIRKWTAGCLLSTAAIFAPAHAEPVSLELLLLADVSGSVNDADFDLQKGGYEAAFRDAAVINAIINGGPIAVSLVYWSEGQAVAVNWTKISDSSSSNAFADAIAAAVRPDSGVIGSGTGMADAMAYGTGYFGSNGFEGSRLVMDVSGDGADSIDCSENVLSCAAVQTARDNALTGGVTTINALWIEDEAQPSDRKFFCLDASCTINPLSYGTTNVIGGTGAFQSVASSFDVFEQRIQQKILREVTGVPEPATLALLGIGLAGLGLARRRKAH